MKILYADNYQSMSRKAANILSAQIILKSNSVLGLATGSTPLGIYRQLIDWYQKGDLDFCACHTVNLDEYVGLDPQNPQSYAWFMQSNLFRQINIDPANTHLPDGTQMDEMLECQRYNALIHRLGGVDLQLLGIGRNGHIGFNEPGTAFEKETHCVRLTESTIQANARFFPSLEQVPTRAYTMGMKAIMQARKILLAVSGAAKADILEASLFGPITPQVPASILQLHPDVTVVADQEALAVILHAHPDQIAGNPSC